MRAAFSQPLRLIAAGLLLITGSLIACNSSVRAPASSAPLADASAARHDRRAVALRYLPGSTVKVEQLIGDIDIATKKRTFNQTNSRYGIWGADLGYSFEHKGRVYFLFGDTLGSYGGDPIGVSDSTDPFAPLALDFLTDFDGKYLRLELDNIAMDGFNVPVGGISLDGTMYVAVKTNYTPGQQSNITLLTRFDEATRRFQVVRELSRMPDGNFITMTLTQAPSGLLGLPADKRYVLMFGSGAYRRSHAYLAAVPVESFESGAGTLYFAGLGLDGRPYWTEVESSARPLINHPTIGDISFTYVPELAMWIALYDRRGPRGVVMRYAPEPWGPWSAPELVWQPGRDPGYGDFIYDPTRTDNAHLVGPTIPPDRDPLRLFGGFYAPYVIERLTRVEGDYVTLHFVMSTWNPYVVLRMRTTLSVER